MMRPPKALSKCNAQGCKEMVQGGYCEAHKFTMPQPTTTAYERGYDGKWQKARAAYLRAHPLCSCGRSAVIVDHIRPHRGDKGVFWDSDNWQSMCRVCHVRKTRNEINNIVGEG